MESESTEARNEFGSFMTLFDSAWIEGVDYDQELFDDEDHQPNEHENEDEDDSDDLIEQYDGMDENELAEIIDEPHGFHVPDETNRNEETVVEQKITKTSMKTTTMNTTKIVMPTMNR
jgi:hypothetical protein